MKKVSFFESIPSFFFDLNQGNILSYLKEMSLFFNRGTHSKTIFLSTILHGNETSGLVAIQRFLKAIQKIESRPNVLILLGNPKAFSENLRLAHGQLDRNRIWELDGSHADHKLAREVIDKVVEYDLFCCVDIHNNTGKNPYFCCLNRMDKKSLGLAKFSKTLLASIKSKSVK